MIFSTRYQRRKLRRINQTFPLVLIPIDRRDWANSVPPEIIEVWRSHDYLVQIYEPKNGAQRITVCATQIRNGDWSDMISWDTLERLKRECGRGHLWAVEIYPPDSAIVNVANMRHLWLLDTAPSFAWIRK